MAPTLLPTMCMPRSRVLSCLPKVLVVRARRLFSAVSEINVRDPYTIEFKLSEPRPKDFMLGAFASGWNIIVRKKTLEENDYSLRKVATFPGTGPFRHVKRVDKEVWIMEKNPNYWNKGLPYLDRLEIYHLAALVAGHGRRAAGRQSSTMPAPSIRWLQESQRHGRT